MNSSRHSRISAAAIALLLAGCVDLRVPDPDVRYVAFGDSATSGPSERDYPDILRSMLGEASKTFANEGESGEGSDEGLDRLRGLLADEIFPNAEVLLYWEGGTDLIDFVKNRDPFLLLSPNDADYALTDDLTARLAETQANIESAVASAKSAGLRVHLATYFFFLEDVGQCSGLPLDIILPGQARNANAYVIRLNERIRAAAVNQRAILVDVAAADETLRQNAANYFNCNHLSEQGNAIVAGLFFESMTGTPD